MTVTRTLLATEVRAAKSNPKLNPWSWTLRHSTVYACQARHMKKCVSKFNNYWFKKINVTTLCDFREACSDDRANTEYCWNNTGTNDININGYRIIWLQNAILLHQGTFAFVAAVVVYIDV